MPSEDFNHPSYAFDIPRYDYLEFTDSRGGKVRYDMKVGTEKWPKVGNGKPLDFHILNTVVRYCIYMSVVSLCFILEGDI